MRRSMVLCRSLFLALCLVAIGNAASRAAAIVDLAGRRVELPAKVERIVLGEGRFLPALAILEEDPASRLVGMMGEFELLDPGNYGNFVKAFPRLANVPRIGRTSQDSFSLEQTLALKPQVAIFGLHGHGPNSRSAEVIDTLQAAGVEIVFIDFRSDPLVNTPKSIALLGQVLGREARAAEFIKAWQDALGQVQDRLSTTRPEPPRVFLESRVGLSEGCCETMVHGMMAGLVDAAGGVNIAKEIIPGQAGTISLEFLLTHQPDIYIGTAIGNGVRDDPEWVTLGAGIPATVAQASLARSMQRVGIAELSAVKDGRAHAIWHHFYNSPFNVVAVQVFAKWLHPELFADLDPEALMQGLYRRFQPFAVDGVYWTSLR
ncbi:ABC transporter substrate-binding protein [Rhodoligotrophos defluvii]|uniref:ABC transporter substrate-binding protein n=1 Tax=Rhodoligotrophos defluvii TaxID=2561934 RepID=UPI0010C9F381|nr:ABC transporter substrate-binding protein [Rhodoligotrophos defluvii]